MTSFIIVSGDYPIGQMWLTLQGIHRRDQYGPLLIPFQQFRSYKILADKVGVSRKESLVQLCTCEGKRLVAKTNDDGIAILAQMHQSASQQATGAPTEQSFSSNNATALNRKQRPSGAHLRAIATRLLPFLQKRRGLIISIIIVVIVLILLYRLILPTSTTTEMDQTTTAPVTKTPKVDPFKERLKLLVDQNGVMQIKGYPAMFNLYQVGVENEQQYIIFEMVSHDSDITSGFSKVQVNCSQGSYHYLADSVDSFDEASSVNTDPDVPMDPFFKGSMIGQVAEIACLNSRQYVQYQAH